MRFIFYIYYLFLLFFQSFVSDESDNQYDNSYNDITDFVTIFGCHYINVIGCFKVCKPINQISEHGQYRIPYSGA